MGMLDRAQSPCFSLGVNNIAQPSKVLKQKSTMDTSILLFYCRGSPLRAEGSFAPGDPLALSRDIVFVTMWGGIHTAGI